MLFIKLIVLVIYFFSNCCCSLYYFADTLGNGMPSLQQPLELYQQWINNMRIVLDQWIRQAINWLQTQWAMLIASTEQ